MMVGPSLSERRWNWTCEATVPKATGTILQAQAEWSSVKRQEYLMAERAVRHHKMVIIINNKLSYPPILIVREKTACTG